MWAGIKGGFWALVLGGGSVIAVAIWVGPPVVQEPQVAMSGSSAATVADAPQEGALTDFVTLDVAFAAPETGALPTLPGPARRPLMWVLQAGSLPQPPLPQPVNITTRPSAGAPAAPPQETPVVAATLPAITEPVAQETTEAVTRTAQAPRSMPASTVVAPEPIPAPATVAPDVAAEDADAETGGALPEDAPALLRFAAAFENPESLPVIGVVLIDDGTLTDGPAQLFESGIVATVAVNALTQDATLWGEAYREAGAEIALQVPLPDGATPADVEITFAAALELLPEAVVLFSDGTGLLRNDQQAAGQVMQILASEGRGFVTIQRGLGSEVRAAERLGVPVATVLRDIDGAGENNSAISRALDRAAFRARQSGDAVVVARLKPRTLQVLRDWATESARDGILLGPVSALLVDRSALEPPTTQESVTPEVAQ